MFMPQITILNLSKLTIQTVDSYKPLLYQLQSVGQDWMHACGGKGRCTTCSFKVVSGADNLTPLTNAEQRYQAQGQLKSNERLACQALIMGDVEIEVPTAYKLPHLPYSY